MSGAEEEFEGEDDEIGTDGNAEPETEQTKGVADATEEELAPLGEEEKKGTEGEEEKEPEEEKDEEETKEEVEEEEKEEEEVS